MACGGSAEAQSRPHQLKQAAESTAEPANASAIPSELASLDSNWSALPNHIHEDITTLAAQR